MAPTICMPEFAFADSYSRRRSRAHHNVSISIKRHRIHSKKESKKSYEEMGMLPTYSPNLVTIPVSPHIPIVSTRTSLKRNLLELFFRTNVLLRKNRILQEKIIALHQETQSSINPVMKSHKTEVEDLPLKEDSIVSSSTEISLKSPSRTQSSPELNKVSSSSETVDRENTDCWVL